MEKGTWFAKMLVWRLKYISDKNFVLILSGVVGCISGLAAVTLKWTVHEIHHLLSGNSDYYVRAIFPFFGLLITYIIAHFFFKEQLGHGITKILYLISKGSSNIKKRMMVSRMLTSAFTVGFGGSVGLEAPIVVTGAAIGSNISREMALHYKERTLLIGCGSAAAVSAIFNSPVAGVIFTIEVILSEVNIKKFIPLLIASVCGSFVSLMLLGDEILFSFKLTESFNASQGVWFVGLGVFCGFVALHFTRTTYFVEGLVHKITNSWSKIAVGGLILGLIIFVFPPMYGEGYNTIKLILAGEGDTILSNSMFFKQIDKEWTLVIFVIGMIIVKGVASSVTIGSGGSGGVFAPSLFIGGISGFLFARVINLLGFTDPVSESVFTLVGMCGVMSGVLHAPLTGIFLIAEITGGYALFVPLMLVSAISFITISYFEPHSIYTKHLIEKGDLITDNKDKQLLSLLDVRKLIEKDFSVIHPDSTLQELTDVIKSCSRNLYPVVNNQCELVGIITLDDVRRIMFDTEMQEKILVRTIMKLPKEHIYMGDNMQVIMKKFEKSGAWNLPVVTNEQVYIGFFSKSKIFNAYRSRLIKQHEEIV